MACFWLSQSETKIKIPVTEEIGAVTYYKIQVNVSGIIWTVCHRYSEFYDLHNQLVTDHGVSKDILPPKKVIRNKDPSFIESRRQGLEAYLRSVLNYLKITMPRIFVEFLEFHIYDIFFLLHHLAAKLFVEADLVLSSTKSYAFNPLQLHAISECFKKPFPVVEELDKRYDLTHVVDLCSQLSYVTLIGSAVPYFQSNIIPNKLSLEFACFKSLKSLTVEGVTLDNVCSVGNLRSTLEKLSVKRTTTKSISQVLQCDIIHKSNIENSQAWTKISDMDLSKNKIAEIDQSICLVPNISSLLLNQNKITSINNLSNLTNLVCLSISDNLLTVCDNLHTKLGNIKILILSQNGISTLKGFSKLYSLETLDASCNQITQIEEVHYVGDLPCLENLILTGNAVATIVDYRVKVLENFGERAKEICLDNEKPSQPELDKVSILRALRIVKEGKTPNLNYASYM